MYVIEVPFLELDKIYESAQPLRWIKLRDGKYVIQDGNSALKVEQQKGRLIMSCTEEEFYDKWFDYFDMRTDYGEAYFSLCRQGDFLKVCAVRNGGVRVIHQDLFECIITHIIYSNCDSNIAGFVLNNFVIACGVKHVQGMREAGKITWYEFPTPEAIVENINKSMLPPGIREIVCGFCEDMLAGWIDIEELKGMDYDDARDCLKEFFSNSQTRDFISLYGLHDLSWFPRNELIDGVIDREFWDFDTMMEDHLEKLGAQKGIVYTYMVNNEIRPPVNMSDEMKVGAHRWG